MSWESILKAKTTSFMVKDEVWNQAGGEGMNSILDLERKLDRELQLSDFNDDPANWSPYWLKKTKSDYPEDYEVLMDRIGGDNGRKELAKEYLKRENWSENREVRYGKTAFHIKEAEALLG